MSVAIKIDLVDRATPAINKLDAKLIDDSVKHSAGASVMRQILDHLTALDEERPNALGGRRTHFYAKAGKSTHYEITDTGAIVSINHIGIAQRLRGGEITPVNSKYLTIPARAEAHGRRAREFNNLEILYNRNGPYALAEREYTTFAFKKGKKGKAGRDIWGKPERDISERLLYRASHGGGIFYWLVKSVTQEGDPTVLPDEDSMEEAVISRVSNYIENLMKFETRMNQPNSP
jgi:hypothetical protein